MTSRHWMPIGLAFAFATAFITAAGTARATNCIDDSDCRAPTPACNGGLCAQCSPTNASACSPRAPVCLNPNGICGCENNGQCGTGLTCTRPAPASGSAPYCVTGCGGGQVCAAGFTCNEVAGRCERDCNLIAICPAAALQNACTQILGGGCVECTNANDTQCAGKVGATVCDTSANRCVQCNVDDDCRGNNRGPRCLVPATPQRSCGCANDTDCGTGRICDDTLKACMDGCRIPGGSKCPPGNQCRIADGGGEVCVPFDAGTGGGGGDAGGGGSDGGGGDAGSGNRDAGRDAGNNAGGGDGDDTTLEGGGWACTMSPAEDALPVGGLVALGGVMALFARRRPRRKD